MSASPASQYSEIEERANAITHGLGVVLGVVGLMLLLTRALSYQADMLTVISMTVYGSSIILLFLASTLYHSITTEKTKRLLKTLDHCAIYLLIAGSYTPFLWFIAAFRGKPLLSSRRSSLYLDTHIPFA